MKKTLSLLATAAVGLLVFGTASANTRSSSVGAEAVARSAAGQLWPGRRLAAPARLKGHKVTHYQWLRCGVRGSRCSRIRGATHRVYIVRAADVGHTLRALLVAKNAVANSAASGVVGHGKPQNTVAPTITDDGAGGGALATPVVGDNLSGTAGTWNTETVGYSYQWFDCEPAGVTITGFTPTTTIGGLNCAPGAGNASPTAESASTTAPTYTLRDTDVNFEVVLEVTGYNT